MQRQTSRKGNSGSVPSQGCEESPCVICLERVRCRGKLSNCTHWFCYPCILEWSKNTNMCPICKARFRCITKTHLSPLKSPPTKLRVPDRDQRVWNDDDDVVSGDLLDDIYNDPRDDLDDDYEPPISIDNPWTLTGRHSHGGESWRQRGQNEFIARETEGIDQYYLEDSFIDDSDLTQNSLPRARRSLHETTYIDSSDEETPVFTRDSPYLLRRQGTFVELSLGVVDEEDHSSISSSHPGSSDNFGVNDLDSDEEMLNLISFGSHNEDRRQITSLRSNSTRPVRATRARNVRSAISQRRISTSSRRETRSQRNTRRNEQETSISERTMQAHEIERNIRETGSTGWISRRTTERTAARTAAQAIAAINASEQESTRSSRRQGVTFSTSGLADNLSSEEDCSELGVLASRSRTLRRRESRETVDKSQTRAALSATSNPMSTRARTNVQQGDASRNATSEIPCSRTTTRRRGGARDTQSSRRSSPSVETSTTTRFRTELISDYSDDDSGVKDGRSLARDTRQSEGYSIPETRKSSTRLVTSNTTRTKRFYLLDDSDDDSDNGNSSSRVKRIKPDASHDKEVGKRPRSGSAAAVAHVRTKPFYSSDSDQKTDEGAATIRVSKRHKHDTTRSTEKQRITRRSVSTKATRSSEILNESDNESCNDSDAADDQNLLERLMMEGKNRVGNCSHNNRTEHKAEMERGEKEVGMEGRQRYLRRSSRDIGGVVYNYDSDVDFCDDSKEDNGDVRVDSDDTNSETVDDDEEKPSETIATRNVGRATDSAVVHVIKLLHRLTKTGTTNHTDDETEDDGTHDGDEDDAADQSDNDDITLAVLAAKRSRRTKHKPHETRAARSSRQADNTNRKQTNTGNLGNRRNSRLSNFTEENKYGDRLGSTGGSDRKRNNSDGVYDDSTNSNDSDDEEQHNDIIAPTPQAKKKRSVITRREHRSAASTSQLRSHRA